MTPTLFAVTGSCLKGRTRRPGHSKGTRRDLQGRRRGGRGGNASFLPNTRRPRRPVYPTQARKGCLHTLSYTLGSAASSLNWAILPGEKRDLSTPPCAFSSSAAVPWEAPPPPRPSTSESDSVDLIATGEHTAEQNQAGDRYCCVSAVSRLSVHRPPPSLPPQSQVPSANQH